MLEFQEVEFNYIYNFAFDPCNWEELNGKIFSNGIPEERLSWVPSQITPGIFSNNKFLYIGLDQKTPKAHSSRPAEIQGTVTMNRGLNSRLTHILYCLVRLKRTGIGSISFSLRVKPDDYEVGAINYMQIEPYLRLTPRSWFHFFNNKVGPREGQEYAYKLNLPGDRCLLLFEILETVLGFLKESKIAELQLTTKRNLSPESPRLGIADQEKDFSFGIYKSANLDSIDFGDAQIGTRLMDTAHPYLYIATKLRLNHYTEIFLDDISTRKSRIGRKHLEYVHRQIAALLYRFYKLEHFKYLDRDFIKSEFQCVEDRPILQRHNINSWFYSHIYRMAAFSCAPQTEYFPYSLISKSMLDMIECGRSKIFALEYVNYWLDQLIYELNDVEEFEQEQMDQMLIPLIRIQRMANLSTADPAIYFYDGHVAYDMIDLIYDRLNVIKLQPTVNEKLSMFRSLLNNVEANIRHKDLSQYKNRG